MPRRFKVTYQAKGTIAKRAYLFVTVMDIATNQCLAYCFDDTEITDDEMNKKIREFKARFRKEKPARP